MTTELEVLLWVSLLTLFMWFPYSLVRIMNFGLITVLKYKVDDKPLSSWAERAKKAHYNSIENLKLSDDKWALLMGNEAHGLSESILSLVDCKIKIPQLGKIESLNVSVACGIFLYHISNKSKY